MKYVDVPEESELNDPTSFEAIEFKARFRVPWAFFSRFLLPWTKEKFPRKADAVGRMGMPTELKLLGVLRILGRGIHFDDIAEFADAGFKGEVIRTFYHMFVAEFSATFFHEWIKPPSDMEEIKRAMRLYELAGVAGAIASIDALHTRWDVCGYSNLQLSKGKEGYATLAYQLAVLHSTWIVSCTQGFGGTTNDKTITRYDDFVQRIQRQELYNDIEFKLFDSDGTLKQLYGLSVSVRI